MTPGLIGRLSRCVGVSAITTTISLTIIVLATTTLGMAPIGANAVATAVATVPSYSLNRRWTWRLRDRIDPWREVVPFWLLSFCGLALSTVTVGMADSWASHRQLAPVVHTTTTLVGHLAGFGLVWAVQFVLLDRVLFMRPGTE